jgi:hypothetical protein
MVSAAYPRREAGARVQPKLHLSTSEAQAHRYFETAAKTTLVPGTVLALETDSYTLVRGQALNFDGSCPGATRPQVSRSAAWCF